MTNFVNSSTVPSFVFNDFTSGGINNLINSGTISPGAFILEGDSTLTGDIENFGNIAGSIIVSDSTINGNVLDNGGTISGGINLVGATITGGVNFKGLVDVFSGYVAGGISIDAQSLLAVQRGNGVLVGDATTNPVHFLSTFAGGIVNSGTIALPSSSAVGLRVERVSTFSGAIVNAGVISGSVANPEDVAIEISLVTVASGGITNSGTILVPDGIVAQNVSTFSGNIVNAGGGTISGVADAIQVGNISLFSGGILNSGTVTAADLVGVTVQMVTDFSGGITNTGVITAGNEGAIIVETVAVFGASGAGGGIVNSGTLAFNSGPTRSNIGGIIVLKVTTFLNGITNAGSIFADVGTGIGASLVSTFVGGIVNSGGGTIAANYYGIHVFDDGTFGGGVANSGTIIVSGAQTGIAVNADTIFLGGITNIGTISAPGAHDIVVAHDSTFAGAIVNSGTILGFNGIGVTSDTVFGNNHA